MVYVAAEAGASILRRFIAWRDERLSDSTGDVPLAILTRGPNLIGGTGLNDLCVQLAAMAADRNVPVSMVVFDTLSRSMHGGDENKAEDMTMVVAAADRLRDQFKAATVFVHHTGKDPSKGARGHSALFAAADVVIAVDNKCGTLEKVRDGVAGVKFPFELEVFKLGEDQDGEVVTTCLLTSNEHAPRRAHPKEPIGRNQLVIWRPLKTLIAEEGIDLPATSSIPQGVKGVSVEKVLERCIPKFAAMPAWRAKARIGEAILGLQAAGFVGVQGDWIWLE